MNRQKSRRNRRTTALIEIVRPATAASMLRTRKLPPFFKIGIVVFCAYMIWNINHPEDSNIHDHHKRDFQLNPVQQPNLPQQNPLASNPFSSGNAMGFAQAPQASGMSSVSSINAIPNAPPAGPPGSTAGLTGIDAMAVGAAGANSEKQQAILESLRRIRWRQSMMQQLQRELFRPGDANAAGVSQMQPIPQEQRANLPASISQAQDRLIQAQAAMVCFSKEQVTSKKSSKTSS